MHVYCSRLVDSVPLRLENIMENHTSILTMFGFDFNARSVSWDSLDQLVGHSPSIKAALRWRLDDSLVRTELSNESEKRYKAKQLG